MSENTNGQFGANTYGLQQYGGAIVVSESATATTEATTSTTETTTAVSTTDLVAVHNNIGCTETAQSGELARATASAQTVVRSQTVATSIGGATAGLQSVITTTHRALEAGSVTRGRGVYGNDVGNAGEQQHASVRSSYTVGDNTHSIESASETVATATNALEASDATQAESASLLIAQTTDQHITDTTLTTEQSTTAHGSNFFIREILSVLVFPRVSASTALESSETTSGAGDSSSLYTTVQDTRSLGTTADSGSVHSEHASLTTDTTSGDELGATLTTRSVTTAENSIATENGRALTPTEQLLTSASTSASYATQTTGSILRSPAAAHANETSDQYASPQPATLDTSIGNEVSNIAGSHAATARTSAGATSTAVSVHDQLFASRDLTTATVAPTSTSTGRSAFVSDNTRAIGRPTQHSQSSYLLSDHSRATDVSRSHGSTVPGVISTTVAEERPLTAGERSLTAIEITESREYTTTTATTQQYATSGSTATEYGDTTPNIRTQLLHDSRATPAPTLTARTAQRSVATAYVGEHSSFSPGTLTYVGDTTAATDFGSITASGTPVSTGWARVLTQSSTTATGYSVGTDHARSTETGQTTAHRSVSQVPTHSGTVETAGLYGASIQHARPYSTAGESGRTTSTAVLTGTEWARANSSASTTRTALLTTTDVGMSTDTGRVTTTPTVLPVEDSTASTEHPQIHAATSQYGNTSTHADGLSSIRIGEIMKTVVTSDGAVISSLSNTYTTNTTISDITSTGVRPTQTSTATLVGDTEAAISRDSGDISHGRKIFGSEISIATESPIVGTQTPSVLTETTLLTEAGLQSGGSNVQLLDNTYAQDQSTQTTHTTPAVGADTTTAFGSGQTVHTQYVTSTERTAAAEAPTALPVTIFTAGDTTRADDTGRATLTEALGLAYTASTTETPAVSQTTHSTLFPEVATGAGQASSTGGMKTTIGEATGAVDAPTLTTVGVYNSDDQATALLPERSTVTNGRNIQLHGTHAIAGEVGTTPASVTILLSTVIPELQRTVSVDGALTDTTTTPKRRIRTERITNSSGRNARVLSEDRHAVVETYGVDDDIIGTDS